jgi:hypothetical protein
VGRSANAYTWTVYTEIALLTTALIVPYVRMCAVYKHGSGHFQIEASAQASKWLTLAALGEQTHT